MVGIGHRATRSTGARVWFEPGQVSWPHLHIFGRPTVRTTGGRVVCEEPVTTDHLGRGTRRRGQWWHGTAASVTRAVAIAGRVTGLRCKHRQRGQWVGLLVEELQRTAGWYRQLVNLRICRGRCTVSHSSPVPWNPFIVANLVRWVAGANATTDHNAADDTTAATSSHVHHGLLGKFELSVRYFAVLALVLPLVAQQLPTGVQNVVAPVPHTVDVITNLREPAVGKTTRVRFHELLEPVPSQLFVLNVIGFMFFWKNTNMCHVLCTTRDQTVAWLHVGAIYWPVFHIQINNTIFFFDNNI